MNKNKIIDKKKIHRKKNPREKKKIFSCFKKIKKIRRDKQKFRKKLCKIKKIYKNLLNNIPSKINKIQ